MLDLKTLLANVMKARDELSQRGIEHAWEHIDGTVIRWDDLVEALCEIDPGYRVEIPSDDESD